MSDDPRVNRRHFFRQGLRELIGPLVQAVAPMEEMLRQLDALEKGDAVDDTSPSDEEPRADQVRITPARDIEPRQREA